MPFLHTYHEQYHNHILLSFLGLKTPSIEEINKWIIHPSSPVPHARSKYREISKVLSKANEPKYEIFTLELLSNWLDKDPEASWETVLNILSRVKIDLIGE